MPNLEKNKGRIKESIRPHAKPKVGYHGKVIFQVDVKNKQVPLMPALSISNNSTAQGH
jgi:hypothetical protein